jgi:hypothetical protein
MYPEALGMSKGDRFSCESCGKRYVMTGIHDAKPLEGFVEYDN